MANTQIAIQELAARELARRELLPFIQRFHTKYLTSWFNEELCGIIDQFLKDVEAGKGPMICISLPPRSGKTTIVSEMLPCFALGKHPEWDVILATYSQALGDVLGRKVRDRLNDSSYQDLFSTALDPSTNAVDFVKTTKGGIFRSTSVGGSLTGLGAHVMIIDDPVKDREQAESIIEQEKLWDWWTSVARTRLHPGGGCIVVHTRWSVNDLIGRLLAPFGETGIHDEWKSYDFPAIAIVDEKYRKAGEALHPERYDLNALNRLRAALPPRDWEALYQGKPFISGGGWFKTDMFDWYEPERRPLCNWFLSGDYATSEKTTADHTAVGAFGLDDKGELWMHEDIIYARLAPLDSVRKTIRLGKKVVAHQLVSEKGAIQNTLEPLFRMVMPEEKFFLIFERYTRSSAKHIHAMAFRGLAEAGKVHLPMSARKWLEPILLRFMPGVDSDDDMIDICAGAGLHIQNAVVRPTPVELPKVPENESIWSRNSRMARDGYEDRKREVEGTGQEKDWW